MNDSLDGVVIAKAAIDRLARDENFVELYKRNSDSFSWMILPNSINPCAPGQGALAIEVAENNNFANLLQPLSTMKVLLMQYLKRENSFSTWRRLSSKNRRINKKD